MSDDAPPARPVPRWLHASAIVAAVSTFLLLAVGQMVTSFRAGMADPIWPTEPWYLFSNYKLDFGYLIEHSHRIFAYAVGGFIILVAEGLWWGEPRERARWVASAGLVILVAGFGAFQGMLIAQRNVVASEIRVPVAAAAAGGVGLLIVLGVWASGLSAGVRGSGLRLLGTVALVAVMIQGLLGGFRVKLNELVGTDLAAVHGVFAQVVFGLLVSLAVLTGRSTPAVSGQRSRALRGWSAALAGLLFVQVVWGAIVRHDPSPLSQRLHFLTAFAATALAVWVIRAVLADRTARSVGGLAAWGLACLLVVQLYLGVEAWMAKFGVFGVLPESVPIPQEYATIRTLHALVGSGLLATSVALAVGLWRGAGMPGHQDEGQAADGWSESVTAGREEHGVVARFGGDGQ